VRTWPAAETAIAFIRRWSLSRANLSIGSDRPRVLSDSRRSAGRWYRFAPTSEEKNERDRARHRRLAGRKYKCGCDPTGCPASQKGAPDGSPVFFHAPVIARGAATAAFLGLAQGHFWRFWRYGARCPVQRKPPRRRGSRGVKVAHPWDNCPCQPGQIGGPLPTPTTSVCSEIAKRLQAVATPGTQW
jgi:hypothetical protein